MKIDYIVRTENIDNDIKLLDNDLVIEEKNKSDYNIKLSDKSIELIKNYYQDDYDFFLNLKQKTITLTQLNT